MGQRGPISLEARMTARRTYTKPRQGARKAAQGPMMPEGLNEAAQAEWKRVTGLLRERGVLDALDQVAVADYLTCWVRLRECEADIESRGVLVQGDRGLVKNPAVQVGRQYRDALVTWSKAFGFTPESRTRLSIPAARPDKEDDPWAKFDL